MKNLKQIIKEEYKKILQEQNQSGFIKTLRIRKVHGNFGCAANNLTSLEGAPTSVGGNFSCHENNLASLEGAPSSVGGDFDCFLNKLTSLEGAPNSVGRFDCSNQKNGVEFTEEDVKEVSNVEGKI